jgi:hypothetical protein
MTCSGMPPSTVSPPRHARHSPGGAAAQQPGRRGGWLSCARASCSPELPPCGPGRGHPWTAHQVCHPITTPSSLVRTARGGPTSWFHSMSRRRQPRRPACRSAGSERIAAALAHVRRRRIAADIARRTTAELSPSATKRPSPAPTHSGTSPTCEERSPTTPGNSPGTSTPEDPCQLKRSVTPDQALTRQLKHSVRFSQQLSREPLVLE